MKRKHVFTIAISLCACAIVLAGCATTEQNPANQPAAKPQADKRPIQERLRVGMTKEEVRTAIGEPSDKAVKSTGEESWTYKDTAKAFIPFYAIGGGKFQFLSVNFDSEGKVKDWSSSQHGLY